MIPSNPLADSIPKAISAAYRGRVNVGWSGDPRLVGARFGGRLVTLSVTANVTVGTSREVRRSLVTGTQKLREIITQRRQATVTALLQETLPGEWAADGAEWLAVRLQREEIKEGLFRDFGVALVNTGNVTDISVNDGQRVLSASALEITVLYSRTDEGFCDEGPDWIETADVVPTVTEEVGP